MIHLSVFIGAAKTRYSVILATLFGVVFGTSFIGPGNLLPWNIEWLSGKGDGASNQLVFQFFRQSPFLQWPMTAIPNFALGANTVNPDGNALFSISAKFLGLLIPGQFQYFGVLIVLWFALQAFFAERLLSRLIDNGVVRLLGMTFFVLSPAFVYRLGSMRHFHVASHWLILAAFYLYFGKTFRRLSWSILLAVSIAINIYIAAIVVPIFFASVARTVLERKHVRLQQAIFWVAELTIIPVCAAAVSFIISGYASYSSSAVGSGFFRLNLFAFINPGYSSNGSFSLLLNSVVPPSSRLLFAEEWEGFQYIGLGAILLMPVVLVLLWQNKLLFLNLLWMPISIASLLLFLFALSNRIMFLQNEINYWWPDGLLQLRQIFRGSSRFGYALYYLITLGGIVAVSRLFAKKFAITILGLLLVLTLVDQSSALWQSHRDLSVTTPIKSALGNTGWGLISGGRTKLVIDKNFDFQVEGTVSNSARIFSDNWFDLAQFAVNHHMSTNFGYVSRPIQAFVKAEDARVAQELSSGKLDPDAVYLVSNRADWIMYQKQMGSNGNAYELDGFFVLVGN